MPFIAEVAGLAIEYPLSGGGPRRVVDGVSLALSDGEAMGLVGESGCGKSLTALSLVGLVPEPGTVVAGTIIVDGMDVRAADETALCSLRGGTVGFVFQEPSQALNPVRSVGYQVGEAARLHLGVSAARAASIAIEVLAEVGLEEPERIARSHAHQLSGGQRQRVLLASALAGGPRVLVADEPTSALDSVSQRRLVELLEELRLKRGLGVLFISHDLELVGRLAERVTVLYAGETVEVATRHELFASPKHPYTRALIDVQTGTERREDGPLPTVPGAVPRAGEWPPGCRFAPRCPQAFERCRIRRPALVGVEGGRQVRCFLASDAEETDGSP